MLVVGDAAAVRGAAWGGGGRREEKAGMESVMFSIWRLAIHKAQEAVGDAAAISGPV